MIDDGRRAVALSMRCPVMTIFCFHYEMTAFYLGSFLNVFLLLFCLPRTTIYCQWSSYNPRVLIPTSEFLRSCYHALTLFYHPLDIPWHFCPLRFITLYFTPILGNFIRAILMIPSHLSRLNHSLFSLTFFCSKTKQPLKL